jgi:chromosomal replication initiation ATPase DnaA
MFKEEQEKMTQEIQSFVNKFENKYNKKLQVIVSELGSSKVNNYTKMWKNEIDALASINITNKLKELERIVLHTMHELDPSLSYLDSMIVKSRRRNVLIWVQCYTYIARTIGFTTTRIGEFINRDHATVLHSVRAVQNMIDTNETDFMLAYKAVLKNIKEYVGIISTNIEGKNDTQSILDSLRDKEESVIAITK